MSDMGWRRLGEMNHDEWAPWCDHDPSHHTEDCDSSFCDGNECHEELRRQLTAYQIAKDNLELRLFKTTKALRALFEEPIPCAIPKQVY